MPSVTPEAETAERATSRRHHQPCKPRDSLKSTVRINIAHDMVVPFATKHGECIDLFHLLTAEVFRGLLYS